VVDKTLDRIKELAAQCNIMELDGYMVNLWDDLDGSMRVRAEQWDKFCKLLSRELNNNATPGSSDVGFPKETDA
jgi:hypothetical protein